MGFFSKKKVIATHSGRFHADDLFACAVLLMHVKGSAKVVRTRDEAIIQNADYVTDVGGIHDPSTHRFDHHQKGGAGVRQDGVPYASFGLVWSTYGAELSGSPEVAAMVEKRLVEPVDADDNGHMLVESKSTIVPYTLQGFLYSFRPTWKEDPKMYDASFMKLLPLAQEIIKREIVIAKDSLEAKGKVEEAYKNAEDKRIIELSEVYPYQETLTAYPEPLYVVLPRFGSSQWKVETVRKVPYAFENRKNLPESWAGLRDQELTAASGVSDAVFCHNGRFLAVAASKEGACALAKKALEA